MKKLSRLLLVSVVAALMMLCLICGCGKTESGVTDMPNSGGTTETPGEPDTPNNGDKIPEEKPPHTHELCRRYSKSPTCTENGNIEYWYCIECEAIFSDCEAALPVTEIELPATGHSYVETIIPPTCTEKGHTTHKCSVCNYEYTDNETPATGHNYMETVISSTCTENGYALHKCSDCGDEYTDNEVAELGHKYKDIVTAPTCTANGYTTHDCERCGHKYTDSKIEATGHSYATEWSCDDECHWHEAVCGCEVSPIKTPHNDVGGQCSDCGKTLWSYKLVTDGSIVTGIEIADWAESVNLVIPDGITEIGDNAFKDEKKIVSVFISKTVTIIGKGAFSGSGIKTAEFEVKEGWITVSNKTGNTGPSAFSKTDRADMIADSLKDNTRYWKLKS